MEPAINPFVYTAPGGGRTISLGPLGLIFKVMGDATHGSLTVIEHILPPGLIAGPPFLHRREDIASYVLEGNLTVWIDNQVKELSTGSMIIKPRNTFHTFWNSGPGIVRCLEIVSPAGFENYLLELSQILEKGPIDPQIRSELWSKYDVEYDLVQLPKLMERYQVSFS